MKLSIYCLIYVATLTNGHKLWVETKRMRSIRAAKSGWRFRDWMRRSDIWEELRVELLLLLQFERSQLWWFGQVDRKPSRHLCGKVVWG